MITADPSRLPGSPAPSPGLMPSPWNAARAFVDRIPRPRTRAGNRKPTTGAWCFPEHQDLPAGETPLHLVLEQIGRRRPGRAAYLRFFHDHQLLPAVRRARAVRLEAEEELAAANDRAAAMNRELDCRLDALRTEAELASAPHREHLEAAQRELEHCREAAALAVGAAGSAFDPDRLASDDLLAVSLPSLASIASGLGLPDVRLDQSSRLPSWLAWGTAVPVGAFIGLSLGILAGVVDADSLARRPAELAALLAVGSGIAVLTKHAIQQTWRLVAERACLGRPAAERAAPLTAALGVSALVLLLDTLVEREGILKLARVQSSLLALGGQEGPVAPEWIWFLIPLLLTLGFVVSAACAGFLDGRVHTWLCRVQGLQDERRRIAGEQRRAQPEVRAALEALHRARLAAARAVERERRLREMEDTWAARLEREDGLRIPLRDDFTPEQKQRIQDALDDVYGATLWFHLQLDLEMEAVEPGVHPWSLFLRCLGGGRRRGGRPPAHD